jgi:hypothetical protein
MASMLARIESSGFSSVGDTENPLCTQLLLTMKRHFTHVVDACHTNRNYPGISDDEKKQEGHHCS